MQHESRRALTCVAGKVSPTGFPGVQPSTMHRVFLPVLSTWHRAALLERPIGQ